MGRSYRITVVYNSMHSANEPTMQALNVCTTNAGLTVLLRMLDSSSDVSMYNVATTTSIPELAVLTYLRASDLGIDSLMKLK